MTRNGVRKKNEEKKKKKKKIKGCKKNDKASTDRVSLQPPPKTALVNSKQIIVVITYFTSFKTVFVFPSALLRLSLLSSPLTRQLLLGNDAKI